jgi:hypothetical protein
MPTAEVVRRYFEGIGGHDLDAAVQCWEPGGVDRLVAQQDLIAPDTEQPRASIRKLAGLDPSAAWAGHTDPVTGDVAAELERAAAAP